jgi:hypothetical protein
VVKCEGRLKGGCSQDWPPHNGLQETKKCKKQWVARNNGVKKRWVTKKEDYWGDSMGLLQERRSSQPANGGNATSQHTGVNPT